MEMHHLDATHNAYLQSEIVPTGVLLGLLRPLVEDLELPDLAVYHEDLLEGLGEPLLGVVKLLLGEGSVKAGGGRHGPRPHSSGSLLQTESHCTAPLWYVS